MKVPEVELKPFALTEEGVKSFVADLNQKIRVQRQALSGNLEESNLSSELKRKILDEQQITSYYLGG